MLLARTVGARTFYHWNAVAAISLSAPPTLPKIPTIARIDNKVMSVYLYVHCAMSRLTDGSVMHLVQKYSALWKHTGLLLPETREAVQRSYLAPHHKVCVHMPHASAR